MATIWDRHKIVWGKKKLLREVYSEYYARIVHDLSPGKTLEIGSGTGNFKEYYPKVITSDIERLPGIDMQIDAHNLPFKPNSLGNIVMIDTLHHLADPVVFLKNAVKTLKSGGRVIMVEPFPSWVSLMVYKKFHKETFIFDKDYFQPQKRDKKAWDSNQAIPYLLFFKHRNKFEEHLGNALSILKAEKTSLFLYPLSGGFEGPQLIPNFLIPIIRVGEKLAYMFRDILAFRCYVVIEKNK